MKFFSESPIFHPFQSVVVLMVINWSNDKMIKFHFQGRNEHKYYLDEIETIRINYEIILNI